MIGTSDTEVLLKWLSLYGTTRMDALDGMFAFCFYDQRYHKVLLARDPIGEKPLYFLHRSNQLFAFASETRTLLETKS